MEPAVRAIVLNLSSVPADSPVGLIAESMAGLTESLPGIPVFSTGMQIEGADFLEGDFASGLRYIAEHVCEDSGDSVAILYGLCPLFTADLFQAARDSHLQYLSDYTLAENIPPGLVPDFARKDFILQLPPGSEADLRAHVLAKLNDYEVELFYRLPDLRQIRLDFSCRDSRSIRLVEDVRKIAKKVEYEAWPDFLREHPEILRPAPSYLELEISSRNHLNPVYFPPLIQKDVDMDPAVLERTIRTLEANGLPGDLTVSLGGRGEPMAHPEFQRILQLLVSSSVVKRVYVETWGDRIDDDAIRFFSSLMYPEKLHIIYRLPSLDADTYRKLHGGNSSLEDVLRSIERVEGLSEAERPFFVYAEVLRIQDVEKELDAYHARFKKSPVQVLVSKYNTYLDALPQRRVSDLTPLYRDFCWHLARDLFVNYRMEVPLCKQDPEGEGKAKDVLTGENILAIWKERMEYHSASFSGNLDRIPMDCHRCDEWYTFNG